MKWAMPSSAGRAILAVCVVTTLAVLVVLGTVRRAPAGPGGEAAQVTLFTVGYEAGHELAGFTGRPMVLLFGDRRIPGWQDFMSSCEGRPEVAKLLSTRCHGVFVDAASDGDAFETYGVPRVPSLMVKDLHGPVLARLEGEFTVDDLLGALEAALPRIRVEASPAWVRLRSGTDLVDELTEKGEGGEVARLLALFLRVEGPSPAYDLARARARERGIVLQGE
jgi:hypothetical protein